MLVGPAVLVALDEDRIALGDQEAGHGMVSRYWSSVRLCREV